MLGRTGNSFNQKPKFAFQGGVGGLNYVHNGNYKYSKIYSLKRIFILMTMAQQKVVLCNYQGPRWQVLCFPFIYSGNVLDVEDMSRSFRDLLTAHLILLQYNIMRNLSSIQNVILDQKEQSDLVRIGITRLSNGL